MSRAKKRKRKSGRPAYDRWTPAEEQLLDRHARRFAQGKSRSVYAAARRAHAALLKMPRDKSSLPRTLIAVHSRLLHRVHKLYPGRVETNRGWSAAELKVLHECARTLKAKGLENSAGAVLECQEKLKRLGPKAGGPRSISAIAQKLRPIARGYDVSPRRDRWSPEEARVAKQWARRFLTIKDELLPWRIHEMGTLMRAELEAKGFKRSRGGCNHMLREMLGRGRRGPVDLDS